MLRYHLEIANVVPLADKDRFVWMDDIITIIKYRGGIACLLSPSFGRFRLSCILG